jgi:hypothetical protein
MPQKAATKATNPILHKIRGFIYTHPKAVFSVIENPYFGIFFSVGRLFGGFSCGARSP